MPINMSSSNDFLDIIELTHITTRTKHLQKNYATAKI